MRIDADRLLKFGQLWAIVLAGAWTLWVYWSYEKERNNLSIGEQRLALEASKLGTVEKALSIKEKELQYGQDKSLEATRQEAVRLSLRQQGLTYSQQQLEYKQQGLAASVQRQQQNNALEEQRLSIKGKSLSLQTGEIDRDSKQVEYEALVQTPLDHTYTLSIRHPPGRDDEYEATLRVLITNRSSRVLYIQRAVITPYVGSLSNRLSRDSIVEINRPTHPGAVQWVPGKVLAYSTPSFVDDNRPNVQQAGWAWGRLAKGETMDVDKVFMVSAATGVSYFGYSLQLTIGEKGRTPWTISYSDHARLEDIDASRNRAGSKAEIGSGRLPVH